MGRRLIDRDSSPWLWIINSWVLVLCTISIVLRLFVRRGNYGLDDLFNLLAYVSLEYLGN